MPMHLLLYHLGDEEAISSEGEESDSRDQSENELETGKHDGTMILKAAYYCEFYLCCVYTVAGVPENLSAAELFARRQAKLTEKKEMIAEIALLVIESPEENVCFKNYRESRAISYAGVVWYILD